MKLRRNVRQIPKMTWVMQYDTYEYRYKMRLEEWHKKLIEFLESELENCNEALSKIPDGDIQRIGYNWNRSLIKTLLGEL